GGVCNRSLDSAVAAVAAMQAGMAVATIAELPAADYHLLSCPDSQIAACAQALAASGVLRAGDVVFHASGALDAGLLQPAAAQGALTGSLHPVRSFSGALLSAQDFAGTYCGLEGGDAALARLEVLVQAIGGMAFRIDAQHKTLYHAASVIACNYLTALQEVSLQTFAAAGVERELAMQLLQPLVSGTVHNVFTQGPQAALTGPIARGDHAVVARQLQALQDWRPELAQLYRLLGTQALSLAQAQGRAQAGDLQQVAQVLAAAESGVHS
ncbi:MAG: Rossmann-like and DUF2520 domain-containing protein, partial [Thiolinea sp.]